MVTAEHDPLRDEGEHLAGLLAEAGVAVTATRYLGQLHGFWRHTAVFPAAEALLRQTAGFLRGHAARLRGWRACACTSAATMPDSTSRTT